MNPHDYEVWHDGVNILKMYVDGVVSNRFTGTGTLTTCAGAGRLAIAQRNSVGHQEWSGGAWAAGIRVNMPLEQQADAMAMGFHNWAIGAGDQ